MKLYSNKADAFIKNLKTPSVLIYGNDVGGVKTMAKTIIKKFLEGEDEQESLTTLTSDDIKDNENIIIDEIASKGFFSSKKLVLLVDPPESSVSALQEAIKSIGSESFILVTGGEMKKESKIRKLFEDSRELTALLCYKEEGLGLKKHITDWLLANKISADMDALEYLVANLGEDMLITNNELEKLSIYLGDERKLTYTDVQHVLADNSDIAVSEIMFEITCKEPKDVEKSLTRAFAEGTASIAIVRSMLWHFNRLLSAKFMIQNGMGVDPVIESLRLFYKHKEPFKNSLRKWNIQQLQDAIKHITKLELEVKSNFADQEMILRDSILKLAA